MSKRQEDLMLIAEVYGTPEDSEYYNKRWTSWKCNGICYAMVWATAGTRNLYDTLAPALKADTGSTYYAPCTRAYYDERSTLASLLAVLTDEEWDEMFPEK